jgi:hypothetical protein
MTAKYLRVAAAKHAASSLSPGPGMNSAETRVSQRVKPAPYKT